MALNSPQRSVVLGANGQDGSLLVEQLLARGDAVLGLGRQAEPRHNEPTTQYRYTNTDLRDADELGCALEQFGPTQVYHLAAIHGASGFPYEAVWGDALNVNLRSLHVVLEYGRVHNRDLRVAYASSSKVFGNPLCDTVSRSTPKHGDCLYSITKIAADDLLAHYTREHGVFGAVAYLFNHESTRRGTDYFIPILVGILAGALRDRTYRQSVRTLDFYCDWGSAREYMGWFRSLLDLESPERLIFATGEVRYARDFVAELFSRHGLDWNDHVVEGKDSHDAIAFAVDVEDTRTALGCGADTDIFAVCEEILAASGSESQ